MKNRIFNWFALITIFSWGASIGIASSIWVLGVSTPALLTALVGTAVFPAILFVVFIFIVFEK
ncbi:MAG: hypothetical protein KKC03_01150 [Bacteroidetes bacterium]|nr:hypothetical protein [Bacteroidota bacterium]